MVTISNEEVLVQNLWINGKTEDEIAGILELDIKKVHAYLHQGRG